MLLLLTFLNLFMSTHLSDTLTTDKPVLHYLVREPKTTPVKKKAIILLHGVGSNEQDLFGLADQLPPDFYIISARGQYTLGTNRYAWYNVDFSSGKPVFDTKQEASSRAVIMHFVQQMKQQYHFDEVYLGGFSQGAIMSYTIGLTHPGEVKGIIVMGGRILEEIRPGVTKNDALAHLKVFISHGVQDGTLPIHYAREAKTYLQTLGVQLSYHEYNNMGHQINQDVLNDLNAWLR